MALFLFFGIFAYTSLMDGHWAALVAEVLKVSTALYFMFWAADSWYFYLGSIDLYAVLLVYVLSSFIISTWLYLRIERVKQVDLVEGKMAKTNYCKKSIATWDKKALPKYNTDSSSCIFG